MATTVQMTPLMVKVERRLREPLGDYLRRRYSVDGMSMRALAKELGVSRQSLYGWILAYGILRRVWREP